MKHETMGLQWHQLDHTQIICNILHRNNYTASMSVANFYSMDILPDAQLQTFCRHCDRIIRRMHKVAQH